MKRAGVAQSFTQGVLVLRGTDPDPPSIGDSVVNDQLDRVGTVVDVFGPVEEPYLAVSPRDGVDPASVLGRRLYVR